MALACVRHLTFLLIFFSDLKSDNRDEFIPAYVWTKIDQPKPAYVYLGEPR